jgi:tRNA (guanine26-N2/guanine27-N2)-dimethyltransferase
LKDGFIRKFDLSFIQEQLKESFSNYREGYAALELDAGFFRPDSILARDFSVLMAASQFQDQKREKNLCWLDLMAGCGIRALRWGLEATLMPSELKSSLKEVAIWVNDADFDRRSLMERNLRPLLKKEIALVIKSDLAEVLLAKAFLDKCFFDLVDLDCFGSPNHLLQPVMKVLAHEGILMLSSTDARSPTGHDRLAAIRSLSASARAHPAAWEIGLRFQLAAVARQAWLLGRGIEPLASFSDGRTFRIYVRLKKRLSEKEETQMGFLSRCEKCGAQSAQTLLKLAEWNKCRCSHGDQSLTINGPLWLGPLQSANFLAKTKKLYKATSLPIVEGSQKFIDRLMVDIGLPLFSWSANDLARRLALDSPPSLEFMINSLRSEGYQAFRNAVVPGQFRTNAAVGELLRICEGKFIEGFK